MKTTVCRVLAAVAALAALAVVPLETGWPPCGGRHVSAGPGYGGGIAHHSR